MKKKEIDEFVIKNINDKEEIFNTLYKIYQKRFNKISSRFSKCNRDDFVQEANLILFKCIQNYNLQKSKSFTTYFTVSLNCVKGEFIYKNSSSLMPRNKYFEYVKLYKTPDSELNDNQKNKLEELSKFFKTHEHPEEFDDMFGNEVDYNTNMILEEILSDVELFVFRGRLHGYSMQEIGEGMNISKQRVGQIIDNIKEKTKELL